MGEEIIGKSIIFIPGNNYTIKHVRPFIRFLEKQPWVEEVIFIQLLENIYFDLDYDRLRPKEYSKYIYKHIPDKSKKYVGFASSMGCYHIQNFSHFYPDVFESIVLLEPTMCGGVKDLLMKFESGRGNKEYITRLAGMSERALGPSLLSNERVIDIAVSSDRTYWFPPKVHLGIIYTPYNAQEQRYNSTQLDAKKDFLDMLKARGYMFKFFLLRGGVHAADTQPRFFRKLGEYIHEVAFEWR